MTAKKTKVTHTLMSTIWGDHGGDLLCFHCGAHETDVLPGDLDEVLRKMKRFGRQHNACKVAPDGIDLRARHDIAFADRRKP